MISQVCHLPYYLNDERCNVVSIYETRKSLIDYFEKNFDQIAIIRDYHNIIEDNSIDAVVVSMPRETNSFFGYEAVMAKKDIFIEKPMAYSYEDALKIHSLVVKNEVCFGIGYMKKHDPGLIKSKKIFHEAVESKLYGSLEKVIFYNNYGKYEYNPPIHKKPEESRDFRYNTWPVYPEYIPKNLQSNYSDFINIGVHNINLIHYFFSSDGIVFGNTAIDNGHLNAFMTFKGIPLELKFNKANQTRWSEGIKFIFSEGSIEVLLPCPMNQKGTSQIICESKKKTKEIEVSKSPWQFEIQAKNFISSLFNKELLVSNSYNGVEDMHLIKQIWSNL